MSAEPDDEANRKESRFLRISKLHRFAVVAIVAVLPAGCAAPAPTEPPAALPTARPTQTPTGKRTFVLVPQIINPYYDTANNGAQEAARELGVTVLYQGPGDYDVDQQIQLINSLIAQKVDGLAISANDAELLAPVGRSAMDAGIPVISWDSGILAEGRVLHIEPAEKQDLDEILVQMASDIAGPSGGAVAILCHSSAHPSRGTVCEGINFELSRPEYSKLTLVDIAYVDGDDVKSHDVALGLLNKYPDLKVIIASDPVGTAAAARAITEKGLIGMVFVTCLGSPNELRAYVKSGAVPQFALWRPDDLGYLTIYTLHALATGKIAGEAGETFEAGKLGSYTIEYDPYWEGLSILLGPPFIWNEDNIDSDYSNW